MTNQRLGTRGGGYEVPRSTSLTYRARRLNAVSNTYSDVGHGLVTFPTVNERLLCRGPAAIMDFDAFVAICGQSIFPEEYRGNLHAARDELDRFGSEESSASPEEKAIYLRCSMFYFVLTGRVKEASNSLKQLHEALATLPLEWGLRYTNCQLLIHHSKRYPPCIRFCQESGRPVKITMLGSSLSLSRMTEQLMEGFHKYKAISTPVDLAVCQFLVTIMSFPMRVRRLTSLLLTLDWDGAMSLQNCNEAVEATISETAGNLVALKEKLDEFDSASQISSYLARLIVELHLACRSPSARKELDKLYSIYERLGDPAGMANCKMIEADSLISPPFTSPISLNLIPIDSSSATGENRMWDPVEQDLPWDYSCDVQNGYASALNLFRVAGCERGQAAVLLRQGCCLHAQARPRSRRDESRYELLKEAREKLDKARALFGLDEANSIIVQGHQVLVDISLGQGDEIHKRAAEIGTWGVDAENENIAHYTGILMLRFARQEHMRFSRHDMAIMAYESAYECFLPLGDILPAFQTLVARAWMQHDMFNFAPAKVLIDKAVLMVDTIVQYYDHKIAILSATELAEDDKKTLLLQKFDLILSFGSTATCIYIRIGDLEALEEWQVKYAWFVEHDNAFQSFRERIEKPDHENLLAALKGRNLWHRSLADEAARNGFATAQMAFQRQLANGNLAEAEKSLNRFMSETSSMDLGYGRDMYRLLACDSLGDFQRARDILDSIPDSALFNDLLDRYLEGGGLRRSFPTIAENVLTFCVVGGDMNRGYRMIQLITKISSSYFDTVDEDASDFAFRLGNYGLIMSYYQPESAFRMLLKARESFELRRAETVDADARIGNFMSGRVVEVFLTLAKICLRCDEADLPLALLAACDHGHPREASWREHALLFLEEARARSVLDSLQSTRRVSDEGKKISEVIYRRRALRLLRLSGREMKCKRKSDRNWKPS